MLKKDEFTGVPDIIAVGSDCTVYIIEVGAIQLDQAGQVIHYKDAEIKKYLEYFRAMFPDKYNVKLYTVYYRSNRGNYGISIFKRSNLS